VIVFMAGHLTRRDFQHKPSSLGVPEPGLISAEPESPVSQLSGSDIPFVFIATSRIVLRVIHRADCLQWRNSARKFPPKQSLVAPRRPT
jgi:hypothetical protein